MAEDPLKLILAKMDALEDRIKLLEPKEDTTPPEDPLKEKATTALRKVLSTSFTKEKLDAFTLEELVIAITLKEDFTPEKGYMPGQKTPPIEKEDALSGVPTSMRAHFNTDDVNMGKLIE